MKGIKVIAVLMIFCLGNCGFNAFALGTKELQLRDEIVKDLNQRGKFTNIQLDSEDESVNFQHDGIIYWITINKTTKPDIYKFSFHQQSIRIANPNENPRFFETSPEYALYAANQMSLNNPYSAALDGEIVKIRYDCYIANVKDFKAVFDIIMGSFQNTSAEFQKYIGEAKSFFSEKGNHQNNTQDYGSKGLYGNLITNSVLLNELTIENLTKLMQSEEFQELMNKSVRLVEEYFDSTLDFRLNK